jgi:long-chain fatty acid transport protein
MKKIKIMLCLQKGKILPSKRCQPAPTGRTADQMALSFSSTITTTVPYRLPPLPMANRAAAEKVKGENLPCRNPLSLSKVQPDMISKPKTTLNIHRVRQIAGVSTTFFLTLAACPTSVFGLGIALPDQDAFATARGNAFVATANNPSAIFYNPAGISQLDGVNFSLGGYGLVYSDRYTGPGGSVNAKTEWTAIPQGFSTFTLPRYNLSFGFGIYSPYGLRMNWPTTAPFVPAGETGQITYLRGAGIISWQIAPFVSIAAGPNLNYSEADLKEFPGFVNHFRGRATDAGYSAGVLFHPAEQHYVGVTYRSATEMNYNGHATAPIPPFTANTAASADFHFPATVAFGYSFRPNEHWNFEADANWSDWSTLRNVQVAPLPENLTFNWSSSWMLDFGVTRYLPGGLRVSGGYMYSENSVPDSNFNPLVPDSDRHIFSVGVGQTRGKFSWDAAYQFAWGPPRNVGGDATAGGLPDGKYEFVSHALTINLGYHF